MDEHAANISATTDEQPEQHPPSVYTCPDCGGTLFRIGGDGDRVISFHCRVGHRYSSESLFEAQEDHLEDALWASLRAMEERIDLATTMAERARSGGRHHSAAFFSKKAGLARRRADALRRVLGEETADEEPSKSPRSGTDRD